MQTVMAGYYFRDGMFQEYIRDLEQEEEEQRKLRMVR